MMSTSQGFSSQRVMNRDSMARTAPMPSKTAPKQSAARMIHRNMQEMPSVFLSVAFHHLER